MPSNFHSITHRINRLGTSCRCSRPQLRFLPTTSSRHFSANSHEDLFKEGLAIPSCDFVSFVVDELRDLRQGIFRQVRSRSKGEK